MSEDFASIVIIKRTGADGPRFPLRRNECLFGRDADCDLRVQLPGVALEHAKISRSENREFYLENLSEHETKVNGNLMKETIELSNLDIFSIGGRSFRFEYEQPKRKSLGQKRLSLNNSKNLASPLKEANRVVKDSPRNPVRRRESLRESMGKLRRSSVPFQEVDEPLTRSPETVEQPPKPLPRRASLRQSMEKIRRSSASLEEANEPAPNTPNPLPRRASLRESIGKLRRSSVPFQEVEEPVIKTPEKAGEQANPLPRRASLRECMGSLRRSSVAFQEVEEPLANTPEKTEEEKLNMATSKSYITTPLSTKKLRKRVSFGPNLSPEQFDKALPVATPVKKGATPRRLSAPLSKPCISPARRRYSVAAFSFVAKIEEEVEEANEISDDDDEVNTPKAESPAVEIVDVVQTERPKLATSLRTEIRGGKKLRATDKKMVTPLKNAIKQGFRLKVMKKKLNTPLRKEIEAGRKLRSTRKRLNTPIRKAIEGKPKLKATRMRVPTPVRKAIEAKPCLRQTKRVMGKGLQDEIKQGKSLTKTKKIMPVPLQEEINTGRKFLRIKRRIKKDLQDEIVAGKVLKATKKKMPEELQVEITKGVKLRPTRKRMPTMLQDEIKAGIELSKTKQSLKTPVRKEIESGVSLRKTKRRMATMLQDEIKSGIELSKTKQSLKTPVRKEIESGVNLRQTKRRMATMLQDEIKSGIELSKTKQSLKTPVRKEIESGVNLRKTKRRMATMLQDEIKSGIELSKTKQSLKTSIRKEIETEVKLRSAKRRDEEEPVQPSKTPKRRFSSVDDDASQSTRKKLKTPSKTPQQAGFFPKTRSKTRSISRRKSTKKPSYADMVKRSKIVAKRRLSTKQKDVFKFGAEQQVVSTSNISTSTATGTMQKVIKKNKTPRRKSMARSKVFDGKTANDWNVVVNKRKILRIKRQRAAKPQQELDMEGVSNLFKTPKATHSKAQVITGKVDTSIERPVRKCRMSSSPGDSMLFGLAKLMKTPKVKQNNEPALEGVAELFEVLEMASPIPVSNTPSLRRASDRVSIVAPLAMNKTPSLRMKDSAADVVCPLPLSSTPSLRKGNESLNVAIAEDPQRTPSLRNISDHLTVALAEEQRQTPSLKRAKDNLTVVAAGTPQNTPCLKKPAENMLVSSPLQANNTPSLKNIPAVIVSASPVQRTPTASVETGKQPKTIAVVSPFPVQSTSPPKSTSSSIQLPMQTAEPSLQQQRASVDDVISQPANEEPSTSKSTGTKRSTRSKRKVEPEALPPAKRPRRAASRSNTANVVIEKLVVEAELPSVRASTRSSKNVATSESLVPKRTSRTRRPIPAEPTLSPTEPVPPQVPLTSPLQPTLEPENITSKQPESTDKAITSKTTRSTRSKCIVKPDTARARRTTRSGKAKVAEEEEADVSSARPSTRSGKTDKKNSVTSETARKTRAKSVKQPEKTPQLSLEIIVEVGNEFDLKNKRDIRASRRKPTNETPKVSAKSNSAPKIATRSGKSKNVTGIPETPQPLQFTRSKLEPIIEVSTPLPTPASSICGGSVKKSLLKSQGSTRSRRGVSTVVEEVVEPVVPMVSDVRDVVKQDIKHATRGRVSRSKRAVTAEKGAEVKEQVKNKNETTGNEKHVTRAKRGIAVVMEEESLPAPKRQKKEAVEAESKEVEDPKSTEEKVKRGGRQTRTAREENVVEELTISSKSRSTRRKKPAVKEIEVVEETVLKYTRTTRQKAKPVAENPVAKKLVEERGKRARKASPSRQTTEEDSASRRKTSRTTRQKVETAPEKEVKGGRKESKRANKTQDPVVEQVTRVTRSRRGAK